MKMNDFLSLMKSLRKETERFCRGSRPDREALESLGYVLAIKCHHPKVGSIFRKKIVQFVIQYGEEAA